MKLTRTIPISLEADEDVLRTIMLTILCFQAVQQYVSRVAHELISNHAGDQWEPPSAITLHHLCYSAVRGQLNSQMICTAIRMVLGALKAARANRHPLEKAFDFRRPLAMWLGGPRGRDVSMPADGTLSLSTVGGRKRLNYTVPQHFKELLADAVCVNSLTIAIAPQGLGRGGGRRRGHDGDDERAANRPVLQAWLAVTIEVPDPSGHSCVGIDRGAINAMVAVADNGNVLFVSGSEIAARNERSRRACQRVRQKIATKRAQKKDVRSLRRLQKRLSLKQRNRNRDFSRRTALALCRWAPPGACFVLESLRLPNARPVREEQMHGRLTGWSHGLLRECILNKAQERSIRVIEVSPAFTSQDCSRCGRRGRRRRQVFHCPWCGYTGHADINAGSNLCAAGLAVLNALPDTRPVV